MGSFLDEKVCEMIKSVILGGLFLSLISCTPSDGDGIETEQVQEITEENRWVSVGSHPKVDRVEIDLLTSRNDVTEGGFTDYRVWVKINWSVPQTVDQVSYSRTMVLTELNCEAGQLKSTRVILFSPTGDPISDESFPTTGFGIPVPETLEEQVVLGGCKILESRTPLTEPEPIFEERWKPLSTPVTHDGTVHMDTLTLRVDSLFGARGTVGEIWFRSVWDTPQTFGDIRFVQQLILVELSCNVRQILIAREVLLSSTGEILSEDRVRRYPPVSPDPSTTEEMFMIEGCRFIESRSGG
jgi:hypothetical protein